MPESSFSTGAIKRSSGISHRFLSDKSDGGDASLVRPSGWNDSHAVTDFIEIPEAASPATPASGIARVYAKTDGRIYSKGDDGVERGPFEGPTARLYVDITTLAAGGDDFRDASLTGWSTSGTPSASVSAKSYDATSIDLSFPAYKDRIYRTLSGLSLSDNFEVVLTTHGVSDYVGMPSLVLVDSVGTGTGIGPYTSSQGVYLWSYTTWGRAGTVATVSTTIPPGSSIGAFPFVYKLRKVGTTLTSYLSYDGGISYTSQSRTDSATHYYVGIVRGFSTASTPVWSIGRFNYWSV